MQPIPPSPSNWRTSYRPKINRGPMLACRPRIRRDVPSLGQVYHTPEPDAALLAVLPVARGPRGPRHPCQTVKIQGVAGAAGVRGGAVSGFRQSIDVEEAPSTSGWALRHREQRQRHGIVRNGNLSSQAAGHTIWPSCLARVGATEKSDRHQLDLAA